MVRISKLTDYAMVIMAFIATAPSELFQARNISEQTDLSLPTVSKLLKILAREKFLNSVRGTHGGYRLAMAAEDITVADLIQALEGPIAITECNLGHQQCVSETNCAIRAPWLHINHVITESLKAITLSDLVNPDLVIVSRPPDNELRDSLNDSRHSSIVNRKSRVIRVESSHTAGTSSSSTEDTYDLQIRH